MTVVGVGSGSGRSGEDEVMGLFRTLYEDYRLFAGSEGARMGISTPPAMIPGGFREIFQTADLPFDESNESLDGSFVAECECDPRRIVQRAELMKLCNGFIESLPDERDRAILRACFWKDDEALVSLGLDVRQTKRQVSVILVELRKLLSLLGFSSGDFY
jgi:hypothetical protein